MKTYINTSVLAALLCSAFTAELHAHLTAFTYQGQLMDNGQPATGLYDLSFHLYDAPTNGNEAATALGFSGWPVTNGLFTVELDFGSNVFTGQPLWLQIEAKSPGDTVWEQLSPRQSLTPTPYAIHALSVDASGLSGTISSTNFAPGTLDGRVLGDNSVSTLKILDGSLLPDDLDAASFNGTFWKADGNAGTTPGSHFIGTTDFQPIEVKVGGRRAARLEPNSDVDAGALPPYESGYSNSVNVVLGSVRNSVALGVKGATIGGGGAFQYRSDSSSVSGYEQANQIAADMGTISGGLWNRIEQDARYAVIGGGAANTIQSNAYSASIGGGEYNNIDAATSSFPWGSYATIGGGINNAIGSDAYAATIGGGSSGRAAGPGSTIGGGGIVSLTTNSLAVASNWVSGTSATVSGGAGNAAYSGSDFATIGGGLDNTIYTNALSATISGGAANTIQTGAQYAAIGGGRINQASSRGATVSGGEGNIASGFRATIGGGVGNTVSGDYAVIPGGANNEAAGDYSFAAGRRAMANHDGSFVWADNINADFASTGPNQFTVRATGGVTFYSGWNSPTGVRLLPGAGSWTSASSVHLKTGFTEIDPAGVLEKVAGLNLSRWRYKTEPQEVEHLGPMAEEFHQAFALGATAEGITTVDADGVALAAIQGLNLKLESELAASRTTIQSLNERLTILESMIRNLNLTEQLP